MKFRFTILFLVTATTGFSQIPQQKFVKKDHDSYRFLQLNSDMSFVYINNNPAYRDSATGIYSQSKDTIFLHSFTPFTDSPLVRLSKGDLSIRPKAFLKKSDKLHLIKNGEVVEKRDQLQRRYKPPKGWRYKYPRKYFLFGRYIL